MASRIGPTGVLVTRTLTMPKDTNPHGDIFGGWIMSQMDIGGALLAKEIAGGRMVTVTADKLAFVRPVKVGEAVCVYAEVVRIGNTSVDVKIEVWANDLTRDLEAGRDLVTTGTFRYVHVGADGRPKRIPDSARER